MMAEEGAQGSRERTVPDTWCQWVTVGTQPAILRDDTTGIDSERRTTTNLGHILYQSFDICSQEGRIRELGLPYSESAVTAAGALRPQVWSVGKYREAAVSETTTRPDKGQLSSRYFLVFG
jgi:hypothetical protein